MTASDAFRFKPAPATPEPDGIIAILIGLVAPDGSDSAVVIDGGAVLKLSKTNLDAGASSADLEIEGLAGFMGGPRGPVGDAPASFDPGFAAVGDPAGADGFAWF